MISVIVPVYNVEAYLDQCLQSIAGQTYREWECILVDDGSKDGSSAICDQWCLTDSRFQVIHQKNQGAAAARNNGIAMAKGDYISFIDGDDWVDSDYLEILIDNIRDADYVITGLTHEYKDKPSDVTKPHSTRFINLASGCSDMDDLVMEGLLYGPVVKLFKTDIIRKNRIIFPVHKIFGEDLEFNFRYLEYVQTIRCIEAAPYHYRIIGFGTLSSKLRPDQFSNDYEQWLIQRRFYDKRKLATPAIDKFLYRRLWGQIYDGLFMYPKIKGAGLSYIQSILNIPSINDLRQRRNLFSCAGWIKWCILHRASIIFFVYFELKKSVCKLTFQN